MKPDSEFYYWTCLGLAVLSIVLSIITGNVQFAFNASPYLAAAWVIAALKEWR